MLAIIQCIISLPVCYPQKKIKIKIHRTVILPVVLYGREALSLTLRKEWAEGVREQGQRGMRYLGSGAAYSNEELRAQHSVPNIIQVLKSRKIR